MEISNTTNQSASAPKSLQQWMRQHALFSYFFLAFAFSWIISIPAVFSTWGGLAGDYTLGLYIKQWVGPALSAILMTRITEGKTGLLSLRHRIRQWRAGWPWYLFIFLGIPALVLLGIVILPDAHADFQGFTPRILQNYPLYFVGIFFATGLPEEIGWRGFALPRMQRHYGPLWSSVLLGALWAFWHLLSFLLPAHGGGPDVSFAAICTNFAIFFVMVVALAIIFTWVFNYTQGSIFIASLVHTAIDAPQLVWVPLFLTVGQTNSAEGEAGLNLALLITFGVMALLVLILTRGQLGYKPDMEQP